MQTTNQKGLLIILSGPSGVGKDTVIDAWAAIDPTVQRVVAYTTRPPRPAEIPGRDYNFVDTQTFQTMASQGHFLEHKEVHGHHYATPLTDLENLLAKGQTAILKIDVQGALAVLPIRPEAVAVFLMPPDLDELERRLRGRATEDEDRLARRLLNAREEIVHAPLYHHIVVNQDIPATVAQLQAIKEEACAASS